MGQANGGKNQLGRGTNVGTHSKYTFHAAYYLYIDL